LSSTLKITLIAFFMIVLGLGLTLYKNLVLGFPLLPGVSEDVWTIESKISLKPLREGPVDVVLALPEPDAGWVSLTWCWPCLNPTLAGYL